METKKWIDTRDDLNKALDKAEGLLSKEGAILRQVMEDLHDIQKCIEKAREVRAESLQKVR